MIAAQTNQRKAKKPKPMSLIAPCPHCGIKMKLQDALDGDVYACPACELELTLRAGELTMEDSPQDTSATAQADDADDQTGNEDDDQDTGNDFEAEEAKSPRGASKSVAGKAAVTTEGKPTGSRAQARKAPAVSASPNRSAALALKDLPDPAQPEIEILRTSPAYWRVHPFAFAGTTFAMVLGVGLAVMMAVRASPAIFVILCGIVAMINAMVFAHGWLRTKSSELRITNKRIIDRDGLLTRHISEVLHKDIKSVRIRQTLWQRARGIGEIAISTDGDEGPEVYMACVTEPKKVQKIIDHYRL
jgi:Zn-finger nucleic acid-binding protein